MIRKDINKEDLRKEFKKNRVVRIENFFETNYAEELHKFFKDEMPKDWWYLSTMPKRPEVTDKTDNTRLFDSPSVNSLIKYKKSLADEHFQQGDFSYSFKRTVGNHVEGCICKECELRSFLNSRQVLNFMNDITQSGVMSSHELFSSLYEEGDFLSIHHDGPNGKLGFVYNLCPGWKPDWGGLLHTLNEEKTEVMKTYVPGFNTLTLFDSSMDSGYPHYVSHVVNKKAKRFSFTGWYK